MQPLTHNSSRHLPAGREAAQTKRVVVVLIKPTSYTDDGFPHRFLRGVLPTNSLAAMDSLTKEALKNVLGPRKIPFEVYALEDGIKKHSFILKMLLSRFPEKGTKLIVGLTAVQTSQFPRACHLIDQWKSVGATCVIGGFHVSGSISTMLDGVVDAQRPDIPCPNKMPEEIQALMDEGTIVFHGEAESVWQQALTDIVDGNGQMLYRGGKPDLDTAPLPDYPEGYFKGDPEINSSSTGWLTLIYIWIINFLLGAKNFAINMMTFDTGRGCPFKCSFCTIINVQGRKPRYRRPSSIIARVKTLCKMHGKASFFFTDDNFARNPLWEEILDGLIALRKRGHEISFMIEADLACGKIKNFIPKLAEAGCTQIFMGVESMNPKNLTEAGKGQNNVTKYKQLWDTCHEYNISVHAGYIIGFPNDTVNSVRTDIEMLVEAGADQASFFMLTLLPGSEDHARAIAAGVQIDPDFGRCDSFHAIFDHPLMSRDGWYKAYRNAWKQFYSMRNMIKILKRFDDLQVHWNLLRNFIWYRWSFSTEQTHPMIAGFYRFRTYADRDPRAPHLPYWKYLRQEVWRHVRYIGLAFSEFYRFQHVIFEVELAPGLSKRGHAAVDRVVDVKDWFIKTFGPCMSRRWLNQFWIKYSQNKWHLLINPLTWRWHIYMIPFAFSELVYAFRFLLKFRRMVNQVIN